MDETKDRFFNKFFIVKIFISADTNLQESWKCIFWYVKPTFGYYVHGLCDTAANPNEDVIRL